MAKKLYDSHIMGICPRCKVETRHMVQIFKKKIYKCLICNDVHVLKV